MSCYQWSVLSLIGFILDFYNLCCIQKVSRDHIASYNLLIAFVVFMTTLKLDAPPYTFFTSNACFIIDAITMCFILHKIFLQFFFDAFFCLLYVVLSRYFQSRRAFCKYYFILISISCFV